MKKKSILIIGSSGFFGQSIFDFLVRSKQIKKKINKIILLSRSKKNKISNLARKSYKVLSIQKDISKVKTLPYADYVIYCVISKNLNKDVKAVANYTKLAKKYHNKSSILYTSSGAIYGNQSISVKNMSEKRVPNPSDHKSESRKKYAITKYKNEKLFKELAKENIRVSIARCFAFVGTNLPLGKNFVVGNFIKNIINNQSLVIKSDKKVLRSYMFADDLVFCLLKLIFSKKRNLKIFNIGSEDKIDIRKLALRLAKKYDLKLHTKKIKDKKNYDIYIPNITKFRKEFKYKKVLDSYKAVIKTIKLMLNNEPK